MSCCQIFELHTDMLSSQDMGNGTWQISAQRANACEEDNTVGSRHRPMSVKWKDNWLGVRPWEWRWLERANPGTSIEFPQQSGTRGTGLPTQCQARNCENSPKEKHGIFYQYNLVTLKKEKIETCFWLTYFRIRNKAFWMSHYVWLLVFNLPGI